MKNMVKKDKKKHIKMNKPELYINHEEISWDKAIPDIDAHSQTISEMTFSYLAEQGLLNFLPKDKPIIISLTLSGDETVHKLNKDFRGIDKATNVLSFANIDDPDFVKDSETYDEVELGDIIISYETMDKEAKEKNISLLEHYSHLLIHGLLHLSGFDHQTDEDADEMEGIEIAILARLNISNPYTE